jgi:hypothetical protein
MAFNFKTLVLFIKHGNRPQELQPKTPKSNVASEPPKPLKKRKGYQKKRKTCAPTRKKRQNL